MPSNQKSSITLKIDHTDRDKAIAEASAEKQKNAELQFKIDAFEKKDADAIAAEQEQKVADEEEKPRKQAKGTVGIYAQPQKTGFNSMSELYSSVRNKAETGDVESKEIMNAWFAKMLQENRNGTPLNVTGKLSDFMGDGSSLADLFNQSRRRKIALKGID